MIRLTVLGTGTVAPSPERTAPAHWVETQDARVLLDCGPGTLHRAAAFGVPWHDVTHVAISHFHPDHWTELPFLLFALRWGVEPRRADPLTLLGPRGLRDRLGHLAAAFGEWVSEPEFALDVVEVEPDATHVLAGETALETCKTPHTEESLAFAVRCGDDRLVYTADTGPSSALAGWAAGCDLLLAECSLPDEYAMDIHLTPASVATLARDARARRLVLTHFYPQFGDADPAALVRRTFDGDVTAARDGDRFDIGT